MITEPIKDNKELQAFLNFYADKKPNLRNHCLIVFGLNTALRISDILNIKWNMIYDFENKKFIKRLTISEHKTGKINIIPINDNLSIALQKFFSKQNPQYNDYIFTKSTDHTRPLSHTQAYRIIKPQLTNVILQETLVVILSEKLLDFLHGNKEHSRLYSWQSIITPHTI